MPSLPKQVMSVTRTLAVIGASGPAMLNRVELVHSGAFVCDTSARYSPANREIGRVGPLVGLEPESTSTSSAGFEGVPFTS